MKYWSNILLAYDGSKSAKKGLEEAIRLGEKFNSKITVLHLYWDMTDVESRHLLKETEDAMKKSKIRYTLRSQLEPVEYVPKRILEILKSEGFDCVVLGARGFKAKDWLLGSVSTKIAAEAPCTVVLSR